MGEGQEFPRSKRISWRHLPYSSCLVPFNFYCSSGFHHRQYCKPCMSSSSRLISCILINTLEQTYQRPSLKALIHNCPFTASSPRNSSIALLRFPHSIQVERRLKISIVKIKLLRECPHPLRKESLFKVICFLILAKVFDASTFCQLYQ
jgi:hypothetical protein